MPRIDSLSWGDWSRHVSASNEAAMSKKHKYPLYERPFLEECYTFQQPECSQTCFCRAVECDGVWTLRQDLEFQRFLAHYRKLWVRGQLAFDDCVGNDSRFGCGRRWKYAVPLLREIGRRWSSWDGHGNSLPFLVSKIRRCYFCDDSFSLIAPIVQVIEDLKIDSRGVFMSKLVSQLFYDTAVPFDTASARSQRACGYEPGCYGDGEMRKQARAWLLANNKSVDDFRKLDGTPSPGCGTACSRVVDKLFYR